MAIHCTLINKLKKIKRENGYFCVFIQKFPLPYKMSLKVNITNMWY